MAGELLEKLVAVGSGPRVPLEEMVLRRDAKRLLALGAPESYVRWVAEHELEKVWLICLRGDWMAWHVGTCCTPEKPQLKARLVLCLLALLEPYMDLFQAHEDWPFKITELMINYCTEAVDDMFIHDQNISILMSRLASTNPHGHNRNQRWQLAQALAALASGVVSAEKMSVASNNTVWHLIECRLMLQDHPGGLGDLYARRRWLMAQISHTIRTHFPEYPELPS